MFDYVQCYPDVPEKIGTIFVVFTMISMNTLVAPNGIRFLMKKHGVGKILNIWKSSFWALRYETVHQSIRSVN